MVQRLLRVCLRWSLRGIGVLIALFVVLVALSDPTSEQVGHKSDPIKGVIHGHNLWLWNAVKLELRVRSDPTDLYARSILVGLYSLPSSLFGPVADRLLLHYKWIIENDPGGDVTRYWDGVPGRGAEITEVWRMQVKRAPRDVQVLYNAAVGVDDPRLAESYLLDILQIDPKNDNAHYTLGRLYEYSGDHFGFDSHTAKVRAFEAYRKAAELSDDNLYLSSAAEKAFLLGDLTAAENYARRLLYPGREQGGWPANAVHDGNTILGRIALRRDDIPKAREHLLSAGRVDGGESGTLKTFGPSMALAEELLAAGEKEVVLQYFAEVSRFWQEGCHGSLKEWEAAIREGRAPDFGNQVLY